VSKPKIAFFDAKPYDIESFNLENKDFEIQFFKTHLEPENISLVQGYEIICLFVNDQVTAAMMTQLKSYGVKLIALRCAGYNNIDLKAAAAAGIRVVRVPAYSPHAVAEHSLALMLTLNRKTHKAYNRTRDNNFTIGGLLGFDMAGKTVGIIGTGQIGKVLIKILKGLEMNVIAYDVIHDEKAAQQLNFKYVPLETLFKESDIISLHCPLNKQTEHIINAKSISLMKNGVMIINTGRGKLIDTPDLIKGLKSKKIGCAGLDVYEEEGDYFFEDYSQKVMDDDTLARLLTFNNVLITSHQAFFTIEAMHQIAQTTLNNIKDFLTNKTLTNEICSA
jgi:D-lactate dehydrogenase